MFAWLSELRWGTLFAAIGLVLVLEGLLLAVATDLARVMYATLSKMPLPELRRMGIWTTVFGLVVLYFVNK